MDFMFLVLLNIELIDNSHADFWWEPSFEILVFVIGWDSIELLLKWLLWELFYGLLSDQFWLHNTQIRFKFVFRHFPAKARRRGFHQVGSIDHWAVCWGLISPCWRSENRLLLWDQALLVLIKKVLFHKSGLKKIKFKIYLLFKPFWAFP